MEWVAVIVAAIAGFGVGAIWYNVFSKAWIAAAGVPIDDAGNPVGRYSPVVSFGGGFLCVLVVAGMMRHSLLASGIDTVGSSAVAGLGVGAFLIAPWITLNVLFAMRPIRLAVIDGAYAAVACAVMGAVMGAF